MLIQLIHGSGGIPKGGNFFRHVFAPLGNMSATRNVWTSSSDAHFGHQRLL